jgi:LmbE family N-acetylglucosaminyl deacetylase
VAARTILVIGAHLDDCEYGAAGLCLKLARHGYRSVFLNTIGDNTNWGVIGRKKQEAFRREARKAAKILGAEKIVYNYRHYTITSEDYELKKRLAGVVQRLNPELALVHWPFDTHFDHRATGRVSFHSLSCAGNFLETDFDNADLKEVFAYEASPSQSIGFRPDFYIDVTDCMERISESLAAFKSLGRANVAWMIEEKKRLCRLRAAECGIKGYAEGYVFLRWRKKISMLPQILGDSFTASSNPRGSDVYR